MSFSARQYLTPQLRRAVEFSRRFRSATIGPLGGSWSISAIHFMANRVSPTSKRILSLITSSAEGSFGNSMMRCRGAFSFVAPLPPSVPQGPSPFHRWNLRPPCTLDLIVGAAEVMNGGVWLLRDIVSHLLKHLKTFVPVGRLLEFVPCAPDRYVPMLASLARN
jgi:hypothetical protein